MDAAHVTYGLIDELGRVKMHDKMYITKPNNAYTQVELLAIYMLHCAL